MKKLLVFLLALIALALLGWFAIYQLKAPSIQADLQQRTQEALTSNNLDWVALEVDGRDVSLSGMAQTEQLKQYALETANVYGVRHVSDKILVKSGAVAPKVPEQTAGAKQTVKNTATHITAAQPAQEKSPKDSTQGEPSTVAVEKAVVKGKPLSYQMAIQKDDAGVYVIEGVIPSTDFKQAVEFHLASLGASPSKTRWQVEVSAYKAPAHWQDSTFKSINMLQLLEAGSVEIAGGKAMMKGVAATQNVSDEAEAIAQKIASDFETADVLFEVVEAKPLAAAASASPMISSEKYAEKFCQIEFNRLLRQEKIQFESGSSQLQKASAELLKKVSTVAGRCPNHQVQVHGYTDSYGAAAANKKLSKIRADAVVTFLKGLGISSERLLAVGHGEAKPIATNKTAAGRAKNRRIKLIVKGLKK